MSHLKDKKVLSKYLLYIKKKSTSDKKECNDRIMKKHMRICSPSVCQFVVKVLLKSSGVSKKTFVHRKFPRLESSEANKHCSVKVIIKMKS